MRYLLDTCVISELVAKRPDEGVVRWVDRLESADTYLSAITIGEVQKGIAKLPDSRRKVALAEWLRDELLARFDERILAADTEVMLRWGELTGALELEGKTMPAMDSLIALHGNLRLVTRNEDDFEHTGVSIINPWSAWRLA